MYSIKYHLYSCIIFFLFIACDSRNEKDVFFAEFPEKLSVKAEFLELEGIIGRPLQILLKDSILIINEFRNDFLLYFYDLKNGRMYKEAAMVGDGPNEFSPPLNLSLSGDGEILSIYERSRFRFKEFGFDDSLNLNLVNDAGPFATGSQNIYKYGEDSFLGLGLFEKGRFCIYNNEAEEVSFFGDYPELPIRIGSNDVGHSLGNDIKAMIFQARLGIKPDGKQFVVANSSTGILEIYQSGANNFEKIVEKSVNSAIKLKDYSSGTILGVNFDDSHPSGYTDIFVSDDYIYMLYSGNTNDNLPNNPLSRTSILVFDWHGSPVKWYELDTQILCFTIDADEKKLYAISDEEEPNLLVFEINI